MSVFCTRRQPLQKVLIFFSVMPLSTCQSVNNLNVYSTLQTDMTRQNFTKQTLKSGAKVKMMQSELTQSYPVDYNIPISLLFHDGVFFCCFF